MVALYWLVKCFILYFFINLNMKMYEASFPTQNAYRQNCKTSYVATLSTKFIGITSSDLRMKHKPNKNSYFSN